MPFMDDSSEKASIRVVPFSTAECPQAPTSGPPLFSWREYYGFRNAVLQVLRRFGSVGPMGEMPLLADWESSEEAWRSETRDPDFFVVDDMWNEWSRWNRVEASPWHVSASVLADLVHMVRDYPGWCVYLALEQGGLTVFGDRILFEGTLFAGSDSIDDLGTRCEKTRPTQ
jgi:hypothetical protein